MFASIVVVSIGLLLPQARGQKIAVIGGAISGSFTTKYLADYDEKCFISDIHIYEPNPVTRPTKVTDSPINDWQGSRVNSLQLNDGSIIEIGASIAHDGNPLILEMIKGDPRLEATRPFHTGKEEEPPQGGFGIFDGTDKWPIPPHVGPKWVRTVNTLIRYNFDLKAVMRVAQQAVDSFQQVFDLLNSTNSDTFYRSPDEIWKTVGLYKAVHMSFGTFLDGLRIYVEPSYIRRLLPLQGNIRDEFLTAVNLVNYNQNVDQVNALVGLGSFAASTGELFSVRGGNYQLIPSAIKQANVLRSERGCEPVQQIGKRVTTVVGSLDGFQLYSGEDWLGKFDRSFGCLCLLLLVSRFAHYPVQRQVNMTLLYWRHLFICRALIL